MSADARHGGIIKLGESADWECLSEELQYKMMLLYQNVEVMNEFERGRRAGLIQAYQEVCLMPPLLQKEVLKKESRNAVPKEESKVQN